MTLKHVHEYRDGELAKKLARQITQAGTDRMTLMEVCGTHTMSIFRYGIKSVLPESIRLLTGPGCPVCVTSQQEIDTFVHLARMKDVIITTFGDLLRVPGSRSSIEKERAGGAAVRIVYSPFDALKTAMETPEKEVIFLAVGFETTIPAIAATVLSARQQSISNFSILASHKLTPPALAALMETDGVDVDGFILPGHVSVIAGTQAYRPVFDKYHIPSVIAGFEPVDILKAILMLVTQQKNRTPALENAYERAVADEGNVKAKEIMHQVFKVGTATWRGIGEIPESGMTLRDAFQSFDARRKFDLSVPETQEPKGCFCGEILMGLKTPDQCRLYNRTCTPMNPVGPCMVSSEGACAAWYKYNR